MTPDAASIRPAELGDVDRVRTIVIAAYASYEPRIGRRPAPMDVDYAALIAASDDVEVLALGDVVVGVLVSRVVGEHMFVENVAIAPTTHGQGFGRLLLAHVEDRAARAGLAGVRLYTNAAMSENVGLYAHLGYDEVGRRRVDGFDRVFFEKGKSARSDE